MRSSKLFASWKLPTTVLSTREIERGKQSGETTEEIILNEDKPLDAKGIACHMREIIKLVGEDPQREGLRKTPERFEKALKFLTSGYHQNLDTILNGATFSVCYDEMVIVKDIEFSVSANITFFRFSAKRMSRTFRTKEFSDSAKSRGL